MANRQSKTAERRTVGARGASRSAVPGALVVFCVDRAVHEVFPASGELVLGREALAERGLHDPHASRAHVSSRLEPGTWRVRDLGSRNGTSVDGMPVVGETLAGSRAIVRMGDTVFVLLPDVTPYRERPVTVREGIVAGAAFSGALEQVRRAAAGRVLHITGPSGAGKELAARTFHEAGPRPGGPFIAVNCAAIPEGVAERVLFGARKGAFSGAHADAPGYLQAASGGTLFLDEVGELDQAVQAKLLRAFECGEVTPIGASRPERVDLRLCSATHRDLAGLVSAKRFRADLLYRIGRPVVRIPPLVARLEELSFLVEREVRAARKTPHASLVEACLLRPWPGNVRELLVEIAAAARLTEEGEEHGRVRASALSPHAGFALPEDPAPREAPAPTALPPRAAPRRLMASPEEIQAALARNEGRVASAARELGVHRNQLRRWLEKHGPLPAPPPPSAARPSPSES